MFKFKLLFVSLICFVSCKSEPHIVIIGAGASGIAAASKLVENGIENITILEAEGRLGGRVHSVPFGDAIIDLGAQWCHGEENNLVYNLVKDLGLVAHSIPNFICLSSGQNKYNISNELINVFITLIDAPQEEISIGEYILKHYNTTVTELYKDDKDKIKYALEMLKCFEQVTLQVEGCFSWFEPSAKSDYDTTEGDQGLNWKGQGYKTIFDVLIKKIPDPTKELPVLDKIEYNKEVTTINWSGSKALIKCADNTEIQADHVIFTPSLGVLKASHESLFSPALPQEKIHAIEELGFGAVFKVATYFPEKWWTGNFPDLYVSWTDEDLQNLNKEFPKGPQKDGQSWLSNLGAFLYVEKNPNVLIVWFSGKFVPDVEVLPEDILVDGIMFGLNKFLGRQYNITRPNKITRPNWFNNPHFRGSYSHQTVKSRLRKESGEVVLAKPLTSAKGVPVLLFAGESTNPTHYSTVHGAIETGFREANRIMELYK